MRICFIFYAPLHAVHVPLLQSSPWISSYSHKSEDFHSQCTFKFKHSEHIFFLGLHIILKKSGRTKENLTHSLPLLAIILNITLLHSIRNTTLQLEGLMILQFSDLGSVQCFERIYFYNYQKEAKYFPVTTEFHQAKKSSALRLWFYTLHQASNSLISYTFYALMTHFVILFIPKGISGYQALNYTIIFFFFGGGWVGKDRVVR